MAVKTSHVLMLLELLAEEFDQTPDYTGFGIISNELDDLITQRYLDDTYREMKRKILNNEFTTRKSKIRLDLIAKRLNYKSFNQFSLSCDKSFSSVVKSCIGNWWSYVRANSGRLILKAPVRIFLDNHKQKIQIELKGAERTFWGDLKEKGGCIFCFLESQTMKQLSVVFKLGDSKKIQVMQGVYCGVSTSGIPIAGKELLVREDRLDYTEMKWECMEINDVRIDGRIQSYFSEECFIKLKNIEGYSLNNLNY